MFRRKDVRVSGKTCTSLSENIEMFFQRSFNPESASFFIIHQEIMIGGYESNAGGYNVWNRLLYLCRKT